MYLHVYLHVYMCVARHSTLYLSQLSVCAKARILAAFDMKVSGHRHASTLDLYTYKDVIYIYIYML